MTMIRVTKSHGGTMNWLRVNGRLLATNRVARITKVGAGEWTGEITSGLAFRIVGGKKAGGTSRDWFLYVNGNPNPIDCVSAVDALTTIANA